METTAAMLTAMLAACHLATGGVRLHQRCVETRVGHSGVIVVESRATCELDGDCARGAGPWHLSEVAADASSARPQSSRARDGLIVPSGASRD